MRCGLPQTIKYAREQEESSSMLRDARWIEADPKTLMDFPFPDDPSDAERPFAGEWSGLE